jgi:hypothetical protein
MSGEETKQSTQSYSSANAPWGPSEKYLKGMMGDANDLYKSGVGGQIYQGSTVIPFANQTTEGMGDIMGIASGAEGAMAKPLSAYSGMMDILSPIARGDFANDSTFLQTLGAGQDAARNAVDQSFSTGGRYGSAMHAKGLGKTIGDFTNQAMLNRQGWAADQQLKYGGAMPSAFASALSPAQSKMGVGSMYEDLASRIKQDELRIFDASQSTPWDQLARASAIFGGAGALGGNTSGKTKTLSPSTQPSFGQQALGFGTTAAATAAGGK